MNYTNILTIKTLVCIKAVNFVVVYLKTFYKYQDFGLFIFS